MERSMQVGTGRTALQAMKKILVIDDSPTVRQQVGLALSQAGYQVVEAVDGVDAIGKVDASIAMLICDVNMPRMNGLEMLEKLRTDARWKALPVVMLTTEGQPGLIERAKKAGAKGWIIKPFKAELLVAAVQRLTA
jgi:two-component system chemotaxis response regulator CheY